MSPPAKRGALSSSGGTGLSAAVADAPRGAGTEDYTRSLRPGTFTAVRVASSLSASSNPPSRVQQRREHILWPSLIVTVRPWKPGARFLGLDVRAHRVHVSMPPPGTPQVIYNQTTSLGSIFFSFKRHFGCDLTEPVIRSVGCSSLA